MTACGGIAERIRSAGSGNTDRDRATRRWPAAEAEAWAYRGLAGLANPIDKGKLRDTYVNLLLERDAHNEAVATRRELFSQNPTQSHYHDLRRTAQRTGHWAGMREEAVERLRAAVAENHAFVNHLIGVLVDEDECGEAWQVAIDHPEVVPESRWHQLVERRQHSHPVEVIKPLQRLIEQRLAASNDKYRYSRTVSTIRQLRDAYDAAGDQSGFATYMDNLRRHHGRKTSFIARLDRAQL